MISCRYTSKMLRSLSVFIPIRVYYRTIIITEGTMVEQYLKRERNQFRWVSKAAELILAFYKVSMPVLKLPNISARRPVTEIHSASTNLEWGSRSAKRLRLFAHIAQSGDGVCGAVHHKHGCRGRRTIFLSREHLCFNKYNCLQSRNGAKCYFN